MCVLVFVCAPTHTHVCVCTHVCVNECYGYMLWDGGWDGLVCVYEWVFGWVGQCWGGEAVVG